MPYLVLLGLIIAALAMAHAFLQAGKAEEAWKEAATRLKLRYVSRGKFGKRTMAGKVDGYTAHCETEKERRGKSSRTFTCYRLDFRKQRHNFNLTRAKALSAVAGFFGSQDIEIGSEEFDRGVVVKSKRPDHVKKFLTPDRQKNVMRVLMAYPGAEISNGRVEWKQTGVATSAAQIEGVFRRFVKLAESLTRERMPVEEEGVMADPPGFQAEIAREEEERARGRELTAALLAGRVADLDQDPRPVHELKPVFEPPKPKPVERVETYEPSSLPENVVLPADAVRSTPERADDATARTEPAPDARFAETGARESASLTTSEPSGAHALTESALGATSMPRSSALTPPPAEAAQSESAAESTHSLAVADVCEHLFAGNQLGMDVTKKFEAHYRDKTVRWTGKLDRVDSFYSDYVFGSGPGAKAVVAVHELEGDTYGSKGAIAVVELSSEEGAALEGSRGETIEIEGKLVRCEPYMRTLFVAKA